MSDKFKVLILGASYGSLLATILVLGEHHVTLVCLPTEADLINREGTIVRFPIRGRAELAEVKSKNLRGTISATSPLHANPEDFDLVVLAMQEPQKTTRDVRDLMERIARLGLPIMSIMNMPPLTLLRRMPWVDVD